MSVTIATELWRMSALDMAEAIRTRQVSSQEVIEAHLRRIEAVDPVVNAVPVVLAEQALETAKAADRTVASGVLKPTLGRIPDASTVAASDVGTIGAQLLSVNGTLARRGADLQGAFETTAGAK